MFLILLNEKIIDMMMKMRTKSKTIAKMATSGMELLLNAHPVVRNIKIVSNVMRRDVLSVTLDSLLIKATV